MTHLPQPPTRLSVWRLIAFAALPLLAGCASGEFGEIYPSFVNASVHDWVGRGPDRVPPSVFEFTDDERALRDLAYPLIEPPFDRNRWYAIINEYGISHVFSWPGYEMMAYGDRLLHKQYRSAIARYEQLNTDIRNDVVRIPDFFLTARRVIDLDSKRALSFAYVTAMQPGEQANATARVAENKLVIAWVQGSLVERSLAYCNALQRLVIATPSPMAVEAERSLTLLNTRIAENRVIASPRFGPTPVACGATVAVVPAAEPVIVK